MSDNKKHILAHLIKSNDKLVQKSLSPTNIDSNNGFTWIEPQTELSGLKVMVEHSTILPQCIRAYKDNIAGFGIEVRYKDDVEETTEMIVEYEKLQKIVDQLNIDIDTKEVFEDIIEKREIYGISYVEVMRDLTGYVNQIESIKEVATIRKTVPSAETIETDIVYKGEVIRRLKQFRTYKQEKNGATVFFKEFGDPRVMNKDTGEYAETLELHQQANEILEFSIGTAEYGTVRWIGQALNIDGSRRAENLNNKYFTNGRHTPLMIIVRGGSLSESSFDKLQQYMDGIKGENGQHSFMVLEVEDGEDKL